MRNYSVRKRVLVTGGAGFIGSHLCDRLLAEGHDVPCVDLVGKPHFELIYNSPARPRRSITRCRPPRPASTARAGLD